MAFNSMIVTNSRSIACIIYSLIFISNSSSLMHKVQLFTQSTVLLFIICGTRIIQRLKIEYQLEHRLMLQF